MSDLHCPARVFLARHAETSYDDGERLTPAGERQARELAAGLAGERIAVVHASSMPRAAATARIAAGVLGVGVELHDDLDEAGVETADAIVARVVEALTDIADRSRGEAVLVVGHQAALGMALAHLLPGVGERGLDPVAPVALEHDTDGWVVGQG